jgi:beta-lactamase regulating signal transducer with metallopeptidase domain
MPVFFLYLLKLSLSLAAVYLLYMLLLRRLTFYRWNRMYLLAYPLACFLIPLIDIAPLAQQTNSPVNLMVNYIPALQQFIVPQNMGKPVAAAAGVDCWVITGYMIGAGILLFVLKLMFQLISFMRIKKKAALISSDGVKLYGINENVIPFSFAGSIYLNPSMYTGEELTEIIRHEYVHVRQKHTFDILLGELLCILNWYNPFAWLLRHAIRQNLEFIADNTVLSNGIDRRTYQYLLLKVTGVASFSMASQFNFSSLKKRIVMMNRIKSARVHMVKFLFVMPLVAVLLLAFRGKAPLKSNYSAEIVPDAVSSGHLANPEIKEGFYGPAASNDNSQDHSVSGKVTPENIYYANGMVLDAITFEPLAGVKVKEEVSGLTTVTDKNGYYSIAQPVSSKELHRRCFFSAPGYQAAMFAGLTLLNDIAEKGGSMVFVGLARNGSNIGFIKSRELPKKNGSSIIHPGAAELRQMYETVRAGITGEREAAAVDTARPEQSISPAALQQIFNQSQQPYYYIDRVHYMINEEGGSTSLAAGWPLMVEAAGVLYTGEALNKKYSRSQLGGQYRLRDATAAEKIAHGALVVLVATVKE